VAAEYGVDFRDTVLGLSHGHQVYRTCILLQGREGSNGVEVLLDLNGIYARFDGGF
jgi:hypothetical protein